MAPSVDNELLREFYQTLSLGPLEPDDRRYVEFYDSTDDPVERLATTIEWAIDPSTQLFMGYRGTGKTTELRRLRRRLAQAGPGCVHQRGGLPQHRHPGRHHRLPALPRRFRERRTGD